MLIYTAAVILAVIIAWAVCRAQVWHDYDITYRILNFIEDHIIIFAGITIAVGWLVIFSLYVYKLLGFLDKIIIESEKLTVPEGDQIRLPADLKAVQDDLNNIREKAAKDSAAAREA